MHIVYLVVGAGLGASLRFFAQYLGSRLLPAYPIGTVAANLAGCFLFGFLASILKSSSFPVKTAIFAGFLGALTTFSSFAYEFSQLALDKRWMAAMAHWSLHSLGCVLACLLGIGLSRFFGG